MNYHPHRLWHWAIGPITPKAQAIAVVTYGACQEWRARHEADIRRTSGPVFDPALIEAVRAAYHFPDAGKKGE